MNQGPGHLHAETSGRATEDLDLPSSPVLSAPRLLSKLPHPTPPPVAGLTFGPSWIPQNLSHSGTGS